jgi:hypothetical protein
MSWLGLAVVGAVIVGGVLFVAMAVIGLRAIKTDGWSPAEAVIGRKIWSKRRNHNVELVPIANAGSVVLARLRGRRERSAHRQCGDLAGEDADQQARGAHNPNIARG